MGLVAREIEAAGTTTVVLSNIHELTASVGAPRVAAIEYPIGLTLGKPGDADGQLAVLKATVHAIETITKPGGVEHLPFEWPDPPGSVRTEPDEPPPIVKLLYRKPWLLPKLLKRDVPR